MNEQIEIEYKMLLNEETFYKILKQYQSQIKKDYIQTNYYLTHPLLQQKRYMLRIREKMGAYELTLKRPMNNHRLETNINISSKEKDDILNHHPIHNEIFNILNHEGISQSELKNPFSLTTHRYDIHLNEGVLSLDENTYLNHHDYELEFEVFDEKAGFQKFLEIIAPFHLFYTTNCPSKIRRVLNVYNQ